MLQCFLFISSLFLSAKEQPFFEPQANYNYKWYYKACNNLKYCMLWAMQNVEQHCGELPKNAPSSLNRRLAKRGGGM